MDPTICNACFGAGYRLWMRQGRPAFLPCIVCAATGMTVMHYGAVGINSLLPDTLPSAPHIVTKEPAAFKARTVSQPADVPALAAE